MSRRHEPQLWMVRVAMVLLTLIVAGCVASVLGALFAVFLPMTWVSALAWVYFIVTGIWFWRLLRRNVWL